jgi:hypothetical protein
MRGGASVDRLPSWRGLSISVPRDTVGNRHMAVTLMFHHTSTLPLADGTHVVTYILPEMPGVVIKRTYRQLIQLKEVVTCCQREYASVEEAVDVWHVMRHERPQAGSLH